MILTIFLDTGPLGLITNPRLPPETIDSLKWAVTMMKAGHQLLVPAIADYELRRELERAGKVKGIASLNEWNRASPGRFVSITDSALLIGAKLWAQARNSGSSTADPKELDGDVLIAAQAIDKGIPTSEFIIATTNAGHLDRFAPADLWSNIKP